MTIYRVKGSILFTVNYKAAPIVGSHTFSSGSKHNFNTKYCPKETVRDSWPGRQNRLQRSFYPAIPWVTSLRVLSPLAEHCHFRYSSLQFSFQIKGRVSRKASMVRSGDLAPQDRFGFRRPRLSQVRHPRGAVPQYPHSLRSAVSSFPATVGERRGHGWREKRAGSRGCIRSASELTS